MKISYDEYLKKIKAILVYLKVVSAKTTLHKESWYHFYEDGYNPLDAVKIDMDCTLPFIQYSAIAEIIKQL